MKLAPSLLMIWLGAFAGIAFAATAAEPVLPDPAYCSQRDADPEKCVIQDGPPRGHIVRKKQPSSQKSPAPASSASRAGR